MTAAPRSPVALEALHSRLRTESLEISYRGSNPIIEDLHLKIPDGEFTAIIGPNGCGKSTLLRALGRILTPTRGSVLLDDRKLEQHGAKRLARQIGLLSQSPTTPGSITVGDLVARGRYPHQSLLRQYSTHDAQVVAESLAQVRLSAAAQRSVEELSGGQRQRAWIAMALAQRTPILLLDEPTTYLDVSHQIEILDLCAELHEQGRTLVAVLHDLNLAARYATHMIAMREGVILAAGSPEQIITPKLLKLVFDLDATVIEDPESGTPLVVPRATRKSKNRSTQKGHLA